LFKIFRIIVALQKKDFKNPRIYSVKSEAINGKDKRLGYPRYDTCRVCGGGHFGRVCGVEREATIGLAGRKAVFAVAKRFH